MYKAELQYVKAGGVCSNHEALKSYVIFLHRERPSLASLQNER